MMLENAKIALFSFLILLGEAIPAENLAAQPIRSVKTIAVIPVSDPTWFSLKNRSALEFIITPLIGVGTAIDSRHKAGEFTTRLKAEMYPFGNELTKALVEDLNQKGFQASVLEGLNRPADDPDGIDYSEVKADADAVLHVYFTDIGVDSGYATVHYLPRVNIYGYLFNPRDGEYIHEDSIYYGVDSREGGTWSVRSDPRFAYASFDELMEKIPEVAVGFSIGAKAAARRLAENIRKAVR